MTCLFQLRADPTLMALLMCSAFSGCYCKGESANLDFSPAVKFGSGCEKSPLQHGGFGCLGRLRTQAMKCLFMVMSLNPAPLISAADFTGLRQRQIENGLFFIFLGSLLTSAKMTEAHTVICSC